MSGETRALAYMAVPCWAIWTWAFIDMLRGNPTAINAVVGLGLGGGMISAAAIALRQQDRHQARAQLKPDLAKIERLERELGIGEQLEKKGHQP
ncbi:hypothetical protein ACFWD7_06370 [Streptomyces mirabilis]|uniref:hypothetical protein n=1 Tax=Streptomyces mirabilis TaxID=68239 RepID=UPI003674CD40